MPDDLSTFASEAGRFREWVLSGTDNGSASVREALVRLTSLYLAGMSLPKGREDHKAAWAELVQHCSR